MTRPLLSALVAAVLLVQPGASAKAQSDADREALINLDMVTISKDLCGFELTDDQASAVASETDRLVSALGLSASDAQALFDQLTEELKRQKPAGLCNPQGAWAKLYGSIVTGLSSSPQ